MTHPFDVDCDCPACEAECAARILNAGHIVPPEGASKPRPEWWTPDNGWSTRIARLEAEIAGLRRDLNTLREGCWRSSC